MQISCSQCSKTFGTDRACYAHIRAHPGLTVDKCFPGIGPPSSLLGWGSMTFTGMLIRGMILLVSYSSLVLLYDRFSNSLLRFDSWFGTDWKSTSLNLLYMDVFPFDDDVRQILFARLPTTLTSKRSDSFWFVKNKASSERKILLAKEILQRKKELLHSRWESTSLGAKKMAAIIWDLPTSPKGNSADILLPNFNAIAPTDTDIVDSFKKSRFVIPGLSVVTEFLFAYQARMPSVLSSTTVK